MASAKRPLTAASKNIQSTQKTFEAKAKPVVSAKLVITVLGTTLALVLILGFISLKNLESACQNRISGLESQLQKQDSDCAATTIEKKEPQQPCPEPQKEAKLEGEPSVLKAQKAIDVAAQDETYKAYVQGKGFDASVYILSVENKEILETQFVIYENLPDTELHVVEFSSETGGTFMAIVDIESGTVEKFFRIAGASV